MVSTMGSANPNTIQDKVLVGYQGWFTCAGDGEPIGPGHHGWLHWFNQPIPNGGRPNTDLWPDTSDYDTSELYPAPGLATSAGEPVHLFSSRHPRTVQRHFHWMALHGVDGAFLQRFAGQCEIKPGNHGIRDLRDEIGDRVREAAEAEGRVFAIMYDVSGVSPDKIQNILEKDWAHLLRDRHLLDSPNYLHEKGRPVVALWGFGFNDRHHTPDLVRAITMFFRACTPGGVYLVAGTPGHWRTSTSDADRNPGFVQVWTECFDAICPWTVGRYGNEEEADRWGQERVKADAEYLNKLGAQGGRKIDYIPVVLPGGSGFNLSGGKWGMNDIPRNGGRFLWRQIYNARRAGVRTIYGAMWDEYDEGTAFMPVVSYSPQLPVHPSFRFVALDVDGHDLPSDWYMRIMGFAAEAFHGQRTLLDTFPVKELQDYWSTRPRDGNGVHEKQADVEAVTRAFRAWEVSDGNVGVPHDAPPPYSLEASPAPQEPEPQAPWVQQQTGRTGGPPVRQDTRPSSSHSHSFGAAAVPLAAAAASYTLSAGRASASPSTGAGALPGHTPPPVNMSSRPPPSTRPSYRPASAGIGMAPPLPLRPGSSSPSSSDGTHAVYDLGRQHARTHAHHSGRVPSLGHGGIALPAPYARGRSSSRSSSKSSSRSRSHSRKRKPKHSHSHSHSHGHGHSPEVHHGQEHRHGHSLSPVGSSHAMAFPGAGAGSYGAYSGGGAYAPVHSHPVGHGGQAMSSSVGPGYAHGQQAYSQGQGQGPHGAYAGHYPSPHQHQQHQTRYDIPGHGYGQGQGQAYNAVGAHQQQQQGYGYAPQPPQGPYGSYVPATGPSMGTPYPGGPSGSGAGGSGGGGIQGGIASALQAVEGIAGKQTRKQLEKTVKTLTNTGSTLFNKLK